MRTISTIVLAAGSGSRFGQAKQFADLTPGSRLVDVALAAASRLTGHLVLVLAAGREWQGQPVDAVVTGGTSRLESVARGLSAVPDDAEVIVVHDAAHPLAPAWMFDDVIEAVVAGADAAVPVQLVVNVVKRVGPGSDLTTVGRDGLGLAQAPMGFSARSLRDAHALRSSMAKPAWEDSMLIEIMGGKVVATEGSARNIHVVTEEDLDLARAVATHGDHRR
ncbi:MAG: 2-C-methyl-D-erythritol 4-phosphate cytidylyltransferase [Acidimicrobiia bacterium]